MSRGCFQDNTNIFCAISVNRYYSVEMHSKSLIHWELQQQYLECPNSYQFIFSIEANADAYKPFMISNPEYHSAERIYR